MIETTKVEKGPVWTVTHKRAVEHRPQLYSLPKPSSAKLALAGPGSKNKISVILVFTVDLTANGSTARFDMQACASGTSFRCGNLRITDEVTTFSVSFKYAGGDEPFGKVVSIYTTVNAVMTSVSSNTNC